MINSNNKIAIIFGAGAVENAWIPILDSFKLIFKNDIDIDGANCYFARQICLLRLYSKYQDPKSLECLKDEREQISLLKEIICYQIKDAQKKGILKPRKEFSKILNKFVFNDISNTFGLVSTNWDSVIDNEADKIVRLVYDNIKSSKCFHIHGDVNSPEDLYLPSETSLENYRSDEKNKQFGYNHFSTMEFLKEANQVILYGISLDPLDAELSQVLNGVFNSKNNLKEIIIINPDFQKIRNRINLLLLFKKNIKVKCFLPEDLLTEL